MIRIHVGLLITLVVAVPAATAGSLFASSTKPCFVTGDTGYELTGAASANFTVRIDNAAARPDLRIQVVDDAATADFVLVDDSDAAEACQAAGAVKSIRIDPAAAKADLTVTLSRAAADTKIYVRSVNYSEQDAAALFAVIWQDARKAGMRREVAKR